MRRFLLLLAAMAITAAAQGSIPTCPGVILRLKASRRMAIPGAQVRLSVRVKISNKALSTGNNVRLGSAVATGWKSMTGKVQGLVTADSVAWLNQEVKPTVARSFKASARICVGVSTGSQTLAEAVLYRLNATGGVTCMVKASAAVRVCWMESGLLWLVCG